MPAKSRAHSLEVGGRQVSITNPEKMLYPEAGFSKAHVIDYYARASDWLLPHLKNRPVTLKRYPNGVREEHFYEKDAPSFTPAWVQRFPVPRRAGGPDIQYILINDLPTLVWSANLANLEIHPFLHRAPRIDRPTMVVFDLDPGPGVDVLGCGRMAFLLKEVLDRLELRSFAKVSGSKGLQIAVPLNTRVTYAATQPFARAVAQLLERAHPELAVSEMAKELRKSKVFIDWSQNADFKTTVGVYSLRAKRAHPFVSMPVTWDELRRAVDKSDASALYFPPDAALKRLAAEGDLWAEVLTLKQALPRGFETLEDAPAALKEYARKRNFEKTAEPAPTVPRRSRQGSTRRFVVQKHAASHLHFDLRLEMHGTLKSWAVPKGIPRQSGEARLAMATEDHPLRYLDFEGTIPKGQYGGGTMMVWDIGTYEIVEGNYYLGNLRVHLNGRKLKGEWTLARDPGAQSEKWRLQRHGATLKKVVHEDRSAVSGRTMEEIAAGADMPVLVDLPPADIAFVEPMRAGLAADLPEGENWVYEIKLDGYRALALKTKDEVRLLSRNNNVLNARFPGIGAACEPLAPDTILDGEIVALDDQGRPRFNALQNYRNARQPVYYYVFDLLAFRGKSLLKEPLSTRRELLDAAVAPLAEPVRVSEILAASPADLIAAARERGLEGLIAKRRNSIYEPGQRSGAWVKVKVNQGQELVIGGYIPGKNGFQSLLVGYYEGKRLIFNAKVKNGFVPHLREEVYRRMKPLETDTCPFDNLPEPKTARRGEALTAEVMKKCRWVKPNLVAQIEFTDWTEADHLRHSRFAGLRDDKDPREVRRETPA